MAIRMSASLGMLLDGRYAPNMPRFPLCDQHHRPGDTIQIQFGGQSLRHAQCTQYPCLRDPQFPKSTQSLAHSPEFEEEGRPAVATVGCLFGPVLLTGLYCVVTHVVSPRLTHAAAHAVTTSRSTSGQHTVLRRRGCQRSCATCRHLADGLTPPATRVSCLLQVNFQLQLAPPATASTRPPAPGRYGEVHASAGTLRTGWSGWPGASGFRGASRSLQLVAGQEAVKATARLPPRVAGREGYRQATSTCNGTAFAPQAWSSERVDDVMFL